MVTEPAVSIFLTNRVLVYRGLGDGNFIRDREFPVGGDPRSVTVTDLNLDRVLDLVVPNQSSNDVSVILGAGGGIFNPERRFPAGGNAYSLAVTDFDQDGFPDLAVAIANDSHDSAVLLFGLGDGAFGPPVLLDRSGACVSICSADFNRDGHPDLAFGHGFPHTISVLLGDGAGGILARPPDLTGADSAILGAADFDGDGVPDLATRTAAFRGHGDGSFGLEVPLGAFSVVYGPSLDTWPAEAIVDLDADGNLDLVGASSLGTRTSGVFVLYNDGQGHLGGSAYRVQNTTYTVVTGDFDGDGFTDLATPSDEEVSVLLGRGDGTFAPETRSPAGHQVSGMAAGDFDGDGRLDLVISPDSGSFVSLLRGTGDGNFLAPVETSIGVTPSSFAVGEFNGDGRADLVCVNSENLSVQMLLGNKDGTFEVNDQVGPQLAASAAAVGDFNADGRQDLAVAYPSIKSVTILPGNGNGTFGPGGFYGVDDYLVALTVADLNGDGKLDLAAGHPSIYAVLLHPVLHLPGYCDSGNVSVLLGGGDGTLGEETCYGSGPSDSVGVADFDQDGHVDLIANSAVILFGAGDGPYRRSGLFAHSGPGVVDDFNRDGRPDVAVTYRGIFVALNQGSSNRHPVAMAGFDTALECASPSGTEVLLDGSASSDLDSTPGTRDDIVAFDWFEDYGLSTQKLLGSGETVSVVLPLGAHSITLRVTDRTGATTTDETWVSVADTVPPQISVRLSPNLLWPPNNQMVDISAEVTVTDACGQPAAILSAIQSSGQASTSRRSAFTGSDVSGADIGTSDFNYQLLAKRSTSKQGWSYLVTYSTTDASGNQSSATGIVRVVNDRRRSSASTPPP